MPLFCFFTLDNFHSGIDWRQTLTAAVSRFVCRDEIVREFSTGKIAGGGGGSERTHSNQAIKRGVHCTRRDGGLSRRRKPSQHSQPSVLHRGKVYFLSFFPPPLCARGALGGVHTHWEYPFHFPFHLQHPLLLSSSSSSSSSSCASATPPCKYAHHWTFSLSGHCEDLEGWVWVGRCNQT